ncbi:unnamed protein product [Auanema sp. JU1783]|nr:unnamed protein product [Auanema sp. JU1783]
MSVSQYSRDQLDTLCMALYKAEDGIALTKLFSDNMSNPLVNPLYASQPVLIAYIYTLLFMGKFDLMFEMIAKTSFEEDYFKELQELWYQGRYKENAVKRGKELGPVEKYRLRRKYPPPASIWDGQETVYSFKENSRKRLRDFYQHNPYPTLEQKKEISRVTELKIVQISNWFKNRRQRDKTSKEQAYQRETLQQTLAYNNIPMMQTVQLIRR